MTLQSIVSALQRLYQHGAIKYSQRRPREQKILWIACVIFAALLLYTAALKPASDFAHNARAAFDSEQQTLEFIRAHADDIRQLNAARQAKTGNDTSLLTLASKTAADHQLTLQRYEPAGDKLSVWLSEAEFNTVLAWLDQLTREYHVFVERANFTPSTKPGNVEVQLVLKQ